MQSKKKPRSTGKLNAAKTIKKSEAIMTKKEQDKQAKRFKKEFEKAWAILEANMKKVIYGI